MPKRVAVIGDTISTDQLFQVWHNYYSLLFGAKHLYVVTYRGLSREFAHVELGGLWEIPENYNDPVRCRVISSLVTALLGSYDYVIRCDIDEMLAPDPRQAPDLAAYIETLDRPYMTGRGMEVIEGHDEPPLNPNIPILIQQRKFCFRASSLNKTCITSVPIEWGPGFHGCTVFPVLRDLYLFHIKHSDLSGRLQWFASLKAKSPGNADVQRYCDTGIAHIREMRTAVLGRERAAGWESFADRTFDKAYLDTVKYDLAKIYLGSFSHDDKLLEIPQEFLGVF
jgi:hypothetical protein